MRFTDYKSIEAPIKLHLEFDQMTVGELSKILMQWQALLRSAWRESYEINYTDRVPTPRLLAVSASTENSFELLSDIAIPAFYFGAALFGPAKDWIAVIGNAYRHFLGLAWSQRSSRSERVDSRHLFIRGGDSPEIRVSNSLIENSETGERIERMWETANSGLIRLTVEVPSDQRDELPPP